nr:hypothetical protein CFP56_39526 [Quercus suber]
MEGLHVGEGSARGNHLRASSKGHRRLEREHRREQQHMQEGYQTRHDSDEGSSQGERTVSYIPKQSNRSDRERELENLQKQVKDLEIKLKAKRETL